MSGNGFEILDAREPEQRARWVEHWARWPGREVSAHPAYVELFARRQDRVLAGAAEAAEGSALFPIVLRPLATEPWAAGTELSSVYDWTTPYGYGGPFAWNAPVPAAFAASFWPRFDDAMRSLGAVSGFARLSLFPDQLLPAEAGLTTTAAAPNVVRSLDLPADDLWMDYEHKVRKNVKTARKAGLTVEVDASGARLDEFLAVYYSTMERRDAATGYYFPAEFFRAIVDGLAGQFVFFHAMLGGKVVSTELVLVSVDNLYSFLGGTLAEAFSARPNDLLKHAVIEWGRENGKKRFVLGGGREPFDGIFKYKLAFAPSGQVSFHVGTRVYDEAAYAQLVEARRQWEAPQGHDWSPAPGFFPAYRA